jgi:hypothetical protein
MPTVDARECRRSFEPPQYAQSIRVIAAIFFKKARRSV